MVFQRFFERTFLLLLPLFFGVSSAHATHNRAGEITYTHVEGLTYEILITTYTKTSAPADRPWLYLYWGDEVDEPIDSLERETVQLLPDDIQINRYRGNHTYGGPGIFEIRVEDPNRNQGVLNIPGSVDVPFSISTLLIIDPLAGHNNSVQLLNPAQQNACLFQPWIHNPGAHDPDGDLLTYDLVPCRGFDSDIIPDYVPPDEVSPADDSFTIDTDYGDVVWDVPQIAGIYNVALRIQEWRDVDGVLIKVGEVVRDMQITVESCTNQPPEIANIPDTCVVAGSFLSFLVNASDPDGDNLDLDAIGGPISEVENPANFSDLGAGIGQFVWSPECTEVREAPYQVVVRAEDNSGQVQLMDLETFQIRVVAPPAEMTAAEPVGNAILLEWNAHECTGELPGWKSSAGRYHIYRRVDSLDWTPHACETGIPDTYGFTFLGTVEGLDNTAYIDEDLLSFGATYCYRVVTAWPGSGESIASNEVCATIRKDVPVITRASVEATDEANGFVELRWSPPTDADTVVFPGPYRYQVWGGAAGGSELDLLHETAPGPYLNAPDTAWVHEGIDTQTRSWVYRVECVSATGEMGMSAPAETPWLALEPNDNALTLTISGSFPWWVDAYDIYREGDAGFEWLATTSASTYTDTGLVNNRTYCYRVETIGHYDGDALPGPLLNWSQRACAKPFDYTPPCPPDFAMESDCVEEQNELAWSNIAGCADDVMAYQLYWAPTLGDTLRPVEIFSDPEQLTYTWNEQGERGTIAGCFAVTALDSLQPGPDGTLRRNESALSDTLCADNCPFYFLPNVFTPNLDQVNDTFRAFPWKFIDSVDVRIYNRLGEEVYQTNDPDINWNGMHKDGRMCADGVYYCTARVWTIRLVGLVEERFSGELHLMGGVAPLSE